MSEQLLDFDEASFEREAINAPGPVLVDFHADWCPPCRAIEPTIRALADEFAGRVTIGRVDVDQEPALGRRFAVHSIPTLLLLVDGKETRRFVGLTPKETLEAALNASIDGIAA